METKTRNLRLNDILHRRQLSSTESRRKILSLFLAEDDALAHGDIEKKVGENFDRVTIYRTLQTFEEKGIIHSIPTADNSILYALCKECEEGHHHDDHVHFVCTNCEKTICLDDVISPKIDLPKGYEAESVQVVIKGVCKECSEP
ncbi:Fur family transcriptional regulator [Flavisolibacter ginsenosidimutans]|uniref:Transcriptional repressor n=1 Tax=Flavisolibacter ginsenosidimutans TaxID=661481 RepID=A0A5B8UL01_9BACT|nr:transcriptional repressor [Flavisolibacter ginsenosidimutans]QEC57243.1 transcriptional repressor [Flavisolibacter ginsenosidimutans]